MKADKGLTGAALLILILSFQVKCNKNKEKIIIPQKTFGIITSGRTAMRIDPMVFAGKITMLKKGESAEIIAKSKQKNWVGKSNDFWYRVKIKNGLQGWVFGENLKVLSSKDEDSVNEIVTEFMEHETGKLRKSLAGKWWSINKFGDFTDHCLEIYENNKYKSYGRGWGKRISGEYNFDFNKNEIIFLQGTSFKNNLDMVKRGQDYILKKDMEDYELRFQKIAIEVSPEPIIKKSKTQAEKDGDKIK